MRNSTALLDGRGFDHHAAGTTHRELTEMDKMPVLSHAIDGGVLAHCRDHNAIAELHLPKRKGGEKRMGLFIGATFMTTMTSMASIS